MNSIGRVYDFLEIVADKQRLLWLYKMQDYSGLNSHIRKVETSYFEYVLYFQILYPKPYLMVDKVNWCAYLLDMIFTFNCLSG